MKATKKIVGAACALVAAVALSAGSTFAWFSSNGTVTATGLEVDVNTNNSYLIIADTTGNLGEGWKTLSLEQIGKVADTSAGAGADAKVPVKLLPSAYMTIDSVDVDGKSVTTSDKTLEGGTTDGPSVTQVSTWYTAQGIDSQNGAPEVWAVGDTYDEGGTDEKVLQDGDSEVGTPKLTTLTTFENYVVVADMVISISEGSTPVEHVYATMTATKSDANKDCPIRVVFLYQTVAPKAGTPAWGDLGAWSKLDVEATAGLGASAGLDIGKVESSDHYIAVKVMVYMDGNKTDEVVTVNSFNLQGVKLDFQFMDKEVNAGTNP